MANNTMEAQLRARVDSFVQDLTPLIRQAALESLQAALGNGPSAPRRGRPAGIKQARASGKRAKRSTEQVDALAGTLLTHVRHNPGQSLEQIGKTLRRTTKDLRLPVLKLLAAKRLSTKGKARGTKYFVK